jgi:hypothetical protein
MSKFDSATSCATSLETQSAWRAVIKKPPTKTINLREEVNRHDVALAEERECMDQLDLLG